MIQIRKFLYYLFQTPKKFVWVSQNSALLTGTKYHHQNHTILIQKITMKLNYCFIQLLINMFNS